MKKLATALFLISLLFLTHDVRAAIVKDNRWSFSDDAVAQAMRSYFTVAVDTPAIGERDYDSTKDSSMFDLGFADLRRHRGTHVFALTEPGRGRQVPYEENFTWIDFNRVTGFFLGAGTSGLEDLGPHDEFGIDASGGYGFADKRWEYRFGGEFRLPLSDVKKLEGDTTYKHRLYTPPTLAIGGEVHNITSTDDDWRAGRLENATYAFFAREDFRDYFKLAGGDAYLAFRPMRDYELRADWRSDRYQSLSQQVYYGRWGGNKVLPPNPAVAEGTMHSLVLAAEQETVHTKLTETTNLFGDSVRMEQLKGTSSLAQVELGHMPGSDFGFNRYLLDVRRFQPILCGVNFDARFRFEATTGDTIFQKLEFLGGPGSLPALYQKSLVGNRMLLLNTELRFNLEMLMGFLHTPDLNLVIYNDFGKIGMAGDGESIVQGFAFSGVSSIVYNVGVGLGWTNGIQVGATWRTDIKADPRVIFRLQRPF
jgi:hypothetical protein